MPLQISPEVFKWLQSQSLVKEARRNQNNLMEITEAQSNRLMDGFVLNVIFRNTFKDKMNEQRLKKLDSLKDNSTPAIRLYNWGILADLLKHLGYNLQYADKSKITNYDPESLSKVFSFLYEIRTKGTNRQQSGEEALKIDINQIGKKTLKDTTNVLQFLTISISKHFKISPQQTLNLFLDNNKYLSHLMAKGVKNSFQPVYTLLQELRSHSDYIVGRLFCLDEEQNVTFLFNALRSCFISKDENVARLCCQFMLDIYDQYIAAIVNLQFLRKWVKDQGMNTLFFSMKKYPLLMNMMITICYNILDDEFFKYIQLSQKSVLWASQKQRYLFYKNFVEESSKEVIQKFSFTNYFQDWNRLFIKTMKKTKDNSEILLLVAIMEEQWGKLNQKFQQSDLGLPNLYINFLKNIVSSPNQLIFVQSSRTLFSLMQSLGQIKNPFAPLIYKILATEYSNSNDIAKIAFMSDNFIISFKGITGLPGSPLMQPLLKHLQHNKDYSVIELAKIMIQERRVDEQESLELVEMMTKVVFSDIRFGTVVLDSLFLSLEHLNEQNYSGFLQNNSKACLAQLYSISKGLSKSIKYLKEENQRLKNQEGGNHKATQAFIENASKHILCKNMIGFLAKSLFIDEGLKRDLQASVFHTFVKIKIELKKVQQAQLLRPIMANYYPEQDELEQKIADYTRIVFPSKPEPQPKVVKGHGHSHSHLSKSVSLRPNTSENVEQQKTEIILDPASLKPSNFAIKDLQKLKQKRYQLKTIQIQKQKQKALKQQRIQKFRTIQYEKRMVQSMTSIKNDVQYKNMLQTQEKPVNIEPQVHQNSQNKEVNVPYIRLISLDKQEEQSYKEDAESILRKYKKVWRYLFFKYSIKKTESGGEEKAHMGDVWKMLKDYQFNFLKKQEVNTIVRLINQNLKRKNEIQFLNYQGFQEFVLQVAMIGYGKSGYAHIPPGQQLLKFVEQLKKITKEKSGNVDIFQNPEEAYFQQTEVIRQYNKRLKQNPDYILPQGYKKTKETSLQYEYQFHPMLQKNIKSSYIDCLEVLDSIFVKHSQLGFHLIEPMTIKLQTYLAKPFLFQSLSQKMKDYTKGYLQPKRTISATNSKEIINISPLSKKEIKPYINFSLGIKLGIAQTSLKNKSVAEEVAYCMEDILNAVQNNSPVVRKGNRKKIMNEVMRRKKIQLAKIDTQKKKEDTNWKKRAESVKLEVQILREKRKQSQKKKKKDDYLQRKKKKQKEEKYFKQRMAEFEKVKAKLAQKKQTLMELKAAEEQKMKNEKQEYRIGVSEYFRKKKQEIRQKQEQLKRKKAGEKEKKEQVEQSKKEFVKKLYLNNLKKEEQVLEKVDQIKETYDDVWKSTQVQQLFTEHKTALKLLFDLLLKYQKSKISATNYDEIGLATLNFFCLKFKIIPFMLQKQDINKIFMYATKDDEQKKSNRKGIHFQKFQQVIFLISTKAKKLLNKLVEKKKKKEKKMQAFLNAKKSNQGNHYQANEVQQSQSNEEQSQDEEKPTLQDAYLFNAQNVSEQTIGQVFSFLKLPNTKPEMEERYKEAMETKTSKPKNVLLKQIKQSIEE